MKNHPPLQSDHKGDDTYKDEYDFIETYSGLHFYPYADQPVFNILDISHALSLCARYNGHTEKFYSVAEHSVLVANLMVRLFPKENPLEGLLHDATEAYLSDVPAPFKQHLPDWRQFDCDLEAKLRVWAGFTSPRPEAVKTCDWLALFIEANQLLPSGGDCFADPEKLRPWALDLANDFTIYAWEPEQAERNFRIRYQDINRMNAMKRITYGPNA